MDDDAVLLCGDSPSQLIDKRQEATHIHVDRARNFGLTLNFNKGKTEALVSWTTQVLSHAARQEDQGAHMLRIIEQVQQLRLVSEYKHVCTWVSSAASSQRDISHKVSVATTGCVQAVKTVFSRRQYTRELRIRAMQVLVESRLLSNSGGWADVTLSQVAKLKSVRSRVLRKILGRFRREKTSISDEKIRKEANVPPVYVLVMAWKTPAGCTNLQRCTTCSVWTSTVGQIAMEATGVG